MTTDVLSRPDASTAVEPLGWRYLLGRYRAVVPVTSVRQALQVVSAAVDACGADADTHLQADLRGDAVELALCTAGDAATPNRITARDVELAEAVLAAVQASGLAFAAPSGPARPVQVLELCIDAIDIPAIRPFWLAVLGMEPEPGDDVPDGAIADPLGQLPALWFQQMDEPRTQRNRFHLDITVAHDEALARVAAAVAAGGTLLDGTAARSFWVLADAEGNEVCVCTWQDREGERQPS